MYFYVAVGFVLTFQLSQVNGLDCYVCNSRNDSKCDGRPVEDVNFVQKCPNQDDVCGMSYTSSIATLEKIRFNHFCAPLEQQREISAYGPSRSIQMKEEDGEGRQLELVQVTFSTCNVSLCNGRYAFDSEPLQCYVCDSYYPDKFLPYCNYEGTRLLSMNKTHLLRCRDRSNLCYTRYDLEPGETVPDLLRGERTCISEESRREILGDKLVVVVQEEYARVHHSVCNATGCNWFFPEEEYLPITCFVCNDVDEPDCDLQSSKLSNDSKLLTPCPNTSHQYCMTWYKEDLRSKKILSVVRSCVSRKDMLQYKKDYGGKNFERVYSKIDFIVNASYYMTVCASSGCNAEFPKYNTTDPMKCFVCPQEGGSECARNRLGTELKTCDNPDDICSIFYQTQVFFKNVHLVSVVRKCISRQTAVRFLELYGVQRDAVMFQDKTNGIQIHMYFCFVVGCNWDFAADREELLPSGPALKCYSCHLPTDKDCVYEMTNSLHSFIYHCSDSENSECFMSYVVNPISEQLTINRSCITVTEIQNLTSQYGKELVAFEGESGERVERHMFHCNYPLCNLRFPDSYSPAISCFECTSLLTELCDIHGGNLPNSLYLVGCPPNDPHVCAIVISHVSETDEIKSVARQCMPAARADFYKATYGEVPKFPDTPMIKDAKEIVYMSFCTEDACNRNFPKPEYLVRKTRPDAVAGAASGELQMPGQPHVPPIPPKDFAVSVINKDKASIACVCSGKWLAFVGSIIISTSLSDMCT